MPQKSEKKSLNISFGGIKTSDLLFFTRQLGLSLKNGLTVFESLQLLANQATGKLKKVLDDVVKVIQSGQTLNSALAHYPRYFSPLYINLVKTGEISGTLEKNLYYLIDYIIKMRDLKQKVKSALTYPGFIFFSVIGLCFAMAIFVLPKIIPLFRTLNIDLPPTTRALIFITDAFNKHGVFIVGGTIAFFVLLFWLLRQSWVKPFSHRLIFHIPIVKGIARNVNLQLMCNTLGTLLVSGITLDTSLKITSEATENRVFRRILLESSGKVQKGNTLASALEAYPHHIPKIVQQMVAMGERTGNLDMTLQYLSEFYEGEVNTVMKNLSSILEPVLLVIIGGIVGVMAMAILGPIYQITGNLN